MKFATFEVSEIFGITNLARYPYKWRVGYDQRDMLAVEHDGMMDWLEDSSLSYVPTGSAIYFKTREDVTLFLLRWA
jgi:hypothetical protein